MKKRIIAALLALTLGVSLCACGETVPAVADPTPTPDGNIKTEIIKDFAWAPEALSTAVYPEMPPYPDETHWDEAKANAWFEAARARRMTAVEGQDALEDFFAKSAAQYLSGQDGENRVYSPANVYMALAMLSELTDGESRRQVLELLGADSLGALRTQAGAVWTRLYQNDLATTSIPAASLWLSGGVPYRQAAIDALANYYYASSFRGSMGDPAYDRMLQDWINEQTGGLLREQAAGLRMDPETLLALAATLYYKARWHSEFSPNATYADVFHGAAGNTEADYLHREGTGTYYWGERFSAVGLSLEGDGTMWFLLPDEGVAPEDLLTDPEAMAFLLEEQYDWENQKFLRIDLSVPKFDVSGDLDLSDGLRAMGVTEVFDSARSDFSPITDLEGVFLSSAAHAARVKIDEEGVEAAAYTVMMTAGAAMPPDELVEFKADRPFLFGLTVDGLPLFLGIVNQVG